MSTEHSLQHADVGRSVRELNTPALLVDLEKFDRNARRMHEVIVSAARVNWRPHVKSIRVPALAHRLLRAGAIGVTCSTVAEAEIMVAGGIGSVLITSQVAGANNAAAVARLAAQAEVMIAVDCLEHVEALEAAAQSSGAQIPVIVEVNIGMNRAGAEPGPPVVHLAQAIHARRGLPGVRLAGLFGWEGGAIAAITNRAEKVTAVECAVKKLTDSAALCRSSGIPIPIVSCGGTGTYWISARCPGVTEIQAGGGVFSDIHYREHYGIEHEHALTVLATVISRPTATRIICDSGWKSMGHHQAVPRPVGLANVSTVSLSAEHATINLDSPSASPRVGDKVEFVVGYSDATVFLHDRLYAVEDTRVTACWTVPRRDRTE